ncbi:MAG: sel1 repeat family protein [Pseudolabrys sp.]|nr:sel1 repeat family protein [Pseudolabrys sp.]
MKALRIILVALAILIAVPLIVMQGIGLYASAVATKAEQAEKQAKQAELDRIANPIARECLRLKQNRPSSFDIDEQTYRQFLDGWIDACTNAVAADASDNRSKIALSNALFAADRRSEAIVPLRQAAATGDTDALVEIFEWHKSWERGDLSRVQIVKRDEAANALKTAAELGNPFAMHRLAVILDRGEMVKRDNGAAIYWAERSLQKPDGEWGQADIATLLGRLLTQSDDPAQRARGIDMLERLTKGGRRDAGAYLAIAIRRDDPVRARSLLESAMWGEAGAALPTLADMLIKGEGGDADSKRALRLLQSNASVGGGAASGFKLGELYRDGQLVQRDPQKAADLMRNDVQWSIDATLELARLVIDNPSVTIGDDKDFLYTLNDHAELGEPNAMAALIALKLSASRQFADRAGGCTLAQRASASGDSAAKNCSRIAGADFHHARSSGAHRPRPYQS